jgi:polyferredoxin
MSQQHMDFDEANRDRAASYAAGYEEAPSYRDYAAGSPGQKISMQEAAKIPTTGQRLLLGIVSLVLLLVVFFGTLGFGFSTLDRPGSEFVQFLLMIGFIFFFVAVIVINSLFNRRR